jgi:hypothetical protein
MASVGEVFGADTSKYRGGIPMFCADFRLEAERSSIWSLQCR